MINAADSEEQKASPTAPLHLGLENATADNQLLTVIDPAGLAASLEFRVIWKTLEQTDELSELFNTSSVATLTMDLVGESLLQAQFVPRKEFETKAVEASAVTALNLVRRAIDQLSLVVPPDEQVAVSKLLQVSADALQNVHD